MRNYRGYRQAPKDEQQHDPYFYKAHAKFIPDLTHSCSQACNRASARGEKPLSRWNKKDILRHLEDRIRHFTPYYRSRLNNLLKDRCIGLETVLNAISKLDITSLRMYFLEYTGAYYIGQYYRYTEFFRVTTSENAIFTVLFNLVPRQIPVVQLKLLAVEDYKIPSSQNLTNIK